jgi:hypothetical protein
LVKIRKLFNACFSWQFGFSRIYSPTLKGEYSVFSCSYRNVTRALADAKPLCTQFEVERMEEVEINSKKYCVRIFGLEEKANLLRLLYIKRGKTVSRIFPDKRDPGWWCFYHT